VYVRRGPLARGRALTSALRHLPEGPVDSLQPRCDPLDAMSADQPLRLQPLVREWRRADLITRLVLFAFALLALASPVYGMLRVKHATAAVIVSGIVILLAVLAVLLAELVYKRRWAWIAFVLLYGSGLVIDLFHLAPALVVLDAIRVALLFSSPMRRHVSLDRTTQLSPSGR
jgi:hypothetical protein